MESDVLVLNTVRMMRAKGIDDWDEIHDVLESGHREQEFPQNAIVTDMRTIPIMQAKQAADYAVIVHERDAALELAKRLEVQLEVAIQREKELAEKFEQARAELEERYEQSRTELVEKYELSRAELEEKLEQTRTELVGRYETKEQKLADEYKERETDIRDKYEKLLREIGRLEGTILAMEAKGQGKDNDQ
jgi:transketolase